MLAREGSRPSVLMGRSLPLEELPTVSGPRPLKALWQERISAHYAPTEAGTWNRCNLRRRRGKKGSLPTPALLKQELGTRVRMSKELGIRSDVKFS